MHNSSRPLILVLPLLLICGCNDYSGRSDSGHWGDRSNWRSDTFIQEYFSDDDGRLIGWIKGSEDSMSIEAHCQYNDNLENNKYDEQLSAQYAVEKYCKFHPE